MSQEVVSTGRDVYRKCVEVDLIYCLLQAGVCQVDIHSFALI